MGLKESQRCILPGFAVPVCLRNTICVIRPLFFPGGDIGTLAVNGTVNDLAMCGARPVALSAGLVIEEGFPLPELRRVVDSMRNAAASANVPASRLSSSL